jgi:hypothetical protein
VFAVGVTNGREREKVPSSGECVEWGLVAFQWLESVRKTCPDGAPSFPFYRSRERPGIHEREVKEQREKAKKKRALGYVALLLW